MSDEIEKRFFETFEVEKLVNQRYHTSIYGSIENCIEKAKEWSKETGIRIKNIEIASDESIYFDKVYYPPTTDSILLNLLCIINKYGNIVSSYNIEKLKDEILIKIITLSEDIDIKPQVRALFLNK